jgi:hypothetical protein
MPASMSRHKDLYWSLNLSKGTLCSIVLAFVPFVFKNYLAKTNPQNFSSSPRNALSL